ncbi:hypothetical protein [Pseudoponticoccus marisrubri]|uniref:Uncharacterized protein n=1 Tax=Pseudoponticoccus marisrubri TaxID=1685382 RepID=A0A0W7WF54_9RHOB|nr:hypothetical protein [Pseudoponticoccus marisrubri]KUF09264.1 hypothetical protein AVJ23_18595 [Pseudoponticoccus marisrubri]
MKKLLAYTTAFFCAAAGALAATDALMPAEPEVIEIEVAPHELQECRDTLAQVAQRPAVSDSGTPLLFDWTTEDLPGVVCVASDTAA